MNWFQRYGIPGAYFVALSAAWVFALSPQARAILAVDNNHTGALAGLAVLIFLPIGYVISIFGQVVYLSWRCCFPRWRWLRRLRGCLGGVHGRAADKAKVKFLGFCSDKPCNKPLDKLTEDEAIIEARTHLMTFSAALREKNSVSTHQFMRDWISRRMDVVAIDFSVILATLIAPVVALVLSASCQQPDGDAVWIVLTFSVIVMAVMVCSMRVLKRQVVEVIAGIYRIYRNDFGQIVIDDSPTPPEPKQT